MPFKIALDWTPVSKWEHFDAISIADGYATTPAKKLAQGNVNLALCPSESIISYRTAASPVALVAVAAILKEDGSAIASKTASRPAELAGKTYASYAARFEDSIVQHMVDTDAIAANLPKGKIQICNPPKLGIWETVIAGKADSTWIFDCWEGVQARRAGEKLNYFKLADFKIPYGYSPVLAVNEETAAEKGDIIRKVLAAIAKGYRAAIADPEMAAKIVFDAMNKDGSSQGLDLDFVVESQRAVSPIYNDGTQFGTMDSATWEDFVNFLKPWLVGRDGSSVEVRTSELWTNKYLQV